MAPKTTLANLTTAAGSQKQYSARNGQLSEQGGQPRGGDLVSKRTLLLYPIKMISHYHMISYILRSYQYTIYYTYILYIYIYKYIRFRVGKKKVFYFFILHKIQQRSTWPLGHWKMIHPMHLLSLIQYCYSTCNGSNMPIYKLPRRHRMLFRSATHRCNFSSTRPR